MASDQESKGLVYEEGNIQVSNEPIEQLHQQEIPHMHGGIVLLRQTNKNRISEALVQRRASNKKQFPNHHCLSAGGHCMEEDFEKDSNFADLATIVRETQEEIGIILNLKELKAYLGNSGKSQVKLQDQFQYSTYAYVAGVHRFDTSLEVPYHKTFHPSQEKPIFSVVYLLLPNEEELQFKIAEDELSGLEWKKVDEIQNSSIKITPWLKYFIDIMPEQAVESLRKAI